MIFYDPDAHRMRLLIRNMNTDTRSPSDVFLAAMYTGDVTNCRSNGDFSRTGNEFFVAVPAQEIEFLLNTPSRPANICSPCPAPIERVSVEVR